MECTRLATYINTLESNYEFFESSDSFVVKACESPH